MTLSVLFNGNNEVIRFQRFDEEKKEIYCITEESSLPVSIAYPLPISRDFSPEKFPPAKFKTFIFQRKNLNENDIFEVFNKSKNTRLGYCFPIQALCSTDHNFANNAHFLPYAYAAAVNLIRDSLDKVCNSPDVTEYVQLSLSDFFISSTAVVTVYLEQTDSPNEFDLRDFFPSLLRFGYVHIIEKPQKEIFYSSINPVDATGQNLKKLQLLPISKEIKNRLFLESVFTNLLPYESNPVLSFFYQYQIIELLLENIFQLRQDKFVKELIENKNDTIKITDAIHELSELASEKNRVQLLMTVYSNIPSAQTDDLLTSCNNFLEAFGKKKGKILYDSLYRTRNTIFHQYRDVHSVSPQLIEEIIKELPLFLIELVCIFSYDDSELLTETHE